jgi:glutamyl-tRNA synthetase
MNAGEPSVVRMKIPTEGSCKFVDGVYGEVEIPWEAVDMQVLLKADGMPTYHMANVVDDHLMKITHVARGEEWLASVPKHILIYQYLGLEPPVFMHLSLMRNADKSKLSKRKNPTSISYYAALGFLPEALMNFLGLFFIQIAEGEELLTMDQLIGISIRKTSPRPARSSTCRSSTGSMAVGCARAFPRRSSSPAYWPGHRKTAASAKA